MTVRVRDTHLHPHLAGLLAIALAAGVGCGGTPCNSECEPGFVCDEVRLACVPATGIDAGTDAGTGCTADDECTLAGALRCKVSVGECVQCLADGDCGGGRCDLATNTCGSEECQRSSDCADVPGRPLCSSVGACVECRTSNDCPSVDGLRRACDPLSSACVENPCSLDADCAVENGKACDPASGRCVACTEDADCLAGRCLVESKRCVACLGDGDCDASAGETCDTSTNACVVTGCASDFQCPGPQRCDTAARACVGCLGDGDCAFGGRCSAGSCVDAATCAADPDCTFGRTCDGGSCVVCVTDEDCAGGQSCAAGACVEPATCATSADCLAGRTCQAGACAPAGCELDALEPNDTAGTARALDVGTIEARLCPNEVDYYAYEVVPGSGVEVTVTHATNLAPVIDVIAADGTTVAIIIATAVTTAPGSQRALVEAVAAGTTALLVRVRSTGLGGAYTLQVRSQSSGLCLNDANEPDDSNVQARAAGRGTYEGVMCASDQDWFQVDVEEGQRVSATLATDGAPGTSTVEIYTLVGASLSRDAFGFGSATARSVAGPGGQRFWVVARNQSTQKLSYRCPASCGTDPGSDPACNTCGLRIVVVPPNDACTSPRTLPLNATSSGTTNGATDATGTDPASGSCGGPGPDVFWKVDLTTASSLRVELQSGFDAVLELSSACGGGSLGCDTGEGAELLQYEALPAGTYILRVDSRSGAGAFTLGVTSQPAAPAPANETCALAESLDVSGSSVSRTGSLALAKDEVTSTCGAPGNDAVWSFSLASARRVRATVNGFEGASLSIVPAATCETAAGARCAAARRATPAAPWVAELDIPALDAGDWTVVVDGGSNRAGAFTLQLETLDPIFPPENDACVGALPLVAGTPATGDTRGGLDDVAPSCGAAGASARDVVYRYTVFSETFATFALDASFDAALSITRDPCGTGATIACDDGRSARLTIPALGPGEYYVWVDGFRDGAGSYSLSVSESPAPPLPGNDLCVNAVAAPLDGTPVAGNTARATNDLAPTDCRATPTGRPLALSGRDVAYRVTVPAGRTLRATVTPTGFDAAVYVVDACAATSCVAAADASFLSGAAETAVARNTSDADVEWLVVVDAYVDGAWGPFSLAVTLDPP